MLITQSAGKFLKRKNSINLAGRLIDFTEPVAMGIINVTPDSFYNSGKMTDKKVLLSAVENMVEEGVTFIDVGGMSTKPGAALFQDRAGKIIGCSAGHPQNFRNSTVQIPSGRVAVHYYEIGPIIVNDISGGTLDSNV